MTPTALQAAIDAWQSIADDWIDAEPLDGDEGTCEQLQLILDAARKRAGMIVVETMK